MRTALILAALSLSACTTAPAAPPPVPLLSPTPPLGPIQAQIAAAIDRIRAVDPQIHSIIAVDPTAMNVEVSVGFPFEKRLLGGTIACDRGRFDGFVTGWDCKADDRTSSSYEQQCFVHRAVVTRQTGMAPGLMHR